MPPPSLRPLDRILDESSLDKGKPSLLTSSLIVREELQAGRDNRLFRLEEPSTGRSFALRVPRSGADTRARSRAMAEYRMTALASISRAGPSLYDAWYVAEDGRRVGKKDACPLLRGRNKGLYLVSDLYRLDLHAAIHDTTAHFLVHHDRVASLLVEQLRTLAKNGIVHTDLKPGNVVCSESLDDVRVIDYGTDFCEWTREPNQNVGEDDSSSSSEEEDASGSGSDRSGSSRSGSSRSGSSRSGSSRSSACSSEAPPPSILSATRDLVGETGTSDLVFLLMLVLLSANVTRHVEKRKVSLNATRSEREALSFLRKECSRARRSATVSQVIALKSLLRHPDIRFHTKHYNGRRDAGTKRTFRLANFVMGQ